MEIINDAETPNGQTADLQNLTHRTADVPRGQAKPCLLCCTLNHPLSRECFNCGWRGSVSLRTAAAPGGPQRLFQTWHGFFRCVSAWFKENA